MFTWVGRVMLLFTVVTHKVDKVGVRVLFTWWGEFTGEVFTVRSVVLRCSAGAISSDGVPGHCDFVGLSNISMRGSQLWMSMTGGIWPAHWVGMVLCMPCA